MLRKLLRSLFGKQGRHPQDEISPEDNSGPAIEEDDVLIVEPGGERIHDRDFRYPNDPPHMIRIFQNSPGGLTYTRDVEVAGISRDDACVNAEALIRGTDRHLTLERDPANPYDRNAIKVIGFWRDNNGNERSGQIGWVPKETARDIAKEHPDAPLAATIRKMFTPDKKRSPGMIIDIHYRNPWPPKEKGKRSNKKGGGAAEVSR